MSVVSNGANIKTFFKPEFDNQQSSRDQNVSDVSLNQFPGQMWVSYTNIFGFQIYFWAVKIFKLLSPCSFSEMIWQHLSWFCPCISDCNEGYQQQLFIKAPWLLQIALHCGNLGRYHPQQEGLRAISRPLGVFPKSKVFLGKIYTQKTPWSASEPIISV